MSIRSTAPYIRAARKTQDVMRIVLISLMPPLAAAVWHFGWRALLLCAVSVLACVLSEFAFLKLSGRQIAIDDLSAAVTGLILALSLPVTVPVWVVVCGAIFAIIVAKQLFGGIGQNIYNPAMAGRIFIMLGFPSHITRYTVPNTLDAQSSATPLAGGEYSLWDLLFGSVSGSMGETSAVMILLGFAILFCTGVVRLHAPLSFLATLALLTFAFAGEGGLFTGSALYALLCGSALFGAVYIVTDYATSPVNGRGRVIFGIIAGALTFFVRTWGVYPEGVCIAVLIANFLSPMIEKLCAPHPYGIYKNADERAEVAS